MLSNTAVPKYYGQFREQVLAGKIPVNEYISMEMNRIDDLIASPYIYYDDQAVEGWIYFCETELVLTDGSDFWMLDSSSSGESRFTAGGTSKTLKSLYKVKTENPATTNERL